MGHYGHRWACTYNGQSPNSIKSKFPSASQIMDGIESLLFEQIDQLKGGQTMWRIPLIKKTFKQVFTCIENGIDLPNMEEPFRINKSELPEFAEYSLDNPNSKATFFVLWFFTMDPPIKLYLNRAIQKNDSSKLE